MKLLAIGIVVGIFGGIWLALWAFDKWIKSTFQP